MTKNNKEKEIDGKKRMSGHDRRNLELLYQVDIQVSLMWIGVTLMAVVAGFFAAYQFEGMTRFIVLIGSLACAFILMCPVIIIVRRTRKILRLLRIDKTITKYLEPQKKTSGK